MLSDLDATNWINLLLLIVSVIAAGIAWRATFAARSAAREANETQKRLLAIEEERERDRKASLRSARFDVSVKSYMDGVHSITFYNAGDADAYAVTFLLNGDPIEGILKAGSVSRFDIVRVGSEAVLEGFLLPLYGPNNVMIQWQDEFGQKRTFNQAIPIK